MMARIPSLVAFVALFLTYTSANQHSETVPNEIGLIFPANGSVVAGSYVDLGFILPPYNGVSLAIALTITFPNKTNVPLLSYDQGVNSSSPSPPFPSSCGISGADAPSSPHLSWRQLRLTPIGNYTIFWSQTLYFWSGVDSSNDPATCTGPVTSTESSLVSRTLVVVPASPGASATDSQGVVTTTHASYLNPDPTNIVTASFDPAPTGKVYVNSAISSWDGAGLWRGVVILLISLGVMMIV